MPRLNTHAYSLAPRRVISFAAPAFREIQLYANAKWPIRDGVDKCLPLSLAGEYLLKATKQRCDMHLYTCTCLIINSIFENGII